MRKLVAIILIGATLTGCTGSGAKVGVYGLTGGVFVLAGLTRPKYHRPASELALKGGYSCDWYAIIKSDCKWTGLFQSESSRTLQGTGDAEICLPDDESAKVVEVQKFSSKGSLSVQIVGPGYKGHPVLTDAVRGYVKVISTGPALKPVKQEAHPTFEDIRVSGYSCDWKCLITTSAKWSGTFSGEEPRELSSWGSAEICLPDDDSLKYAAVMLTEESGILTVQIIGPNYEGNPQFINAPYGSITVTTADIHR